MTSDEMTARAAIQCLLADCVMAIDGGRLDDMLAHFTEDGILETPRWTQRGRAAIGETLRTVASRRINPGRTFVRHHITSSQLHLTDISHATGRTYFIVFTDVGLDHAGFYEDHFRKINDCWQIEYRKIHADWIAANSLSELGVQASDPLPDSHQPE